MSSASTLVSSPSDPNVGQLDAMHVANTVPQTLVFATHTTPSSADATTESHDSGHESKQVYAAPNGIWPNPTQDEPNVAGGKGEAETVLWGRLREYEAEEALAINRNLYTRHLRQTALANDDGAATDSARVPKLQDKFAPDGNLLFTDRYIRRFQEEEERLKSEQMSWTRSLSTNATVSAPAPATAASPHAAYVGAKESDACDIERRANGSTAATDYYDYDEEKDAEAEAEAEGDDSSVPFSASSSSSSSSSFAHMRSGFSALRKKFPKVLSLASKKRTQQRRDKGKEAAAGAYGSPLLESAPWPAYADVLPTPAYGTAAAVPRRASGLAAGHHHGTTALRSAADDTDPSLQQQQQPYFKDHPASVLAASAGAFDKTWAQDYSPFSSFAFDKPQSRAPDTPRVEAAVEPSFTAFGAGDYASDDDMPPLIDINPHQ